MKYIIAILTVLLIAASAWATVIRNGVMNSITIRPAVDTCPAGYSGLLDSTGAYILDSGGSYICAPN